MLMEHIIKQTHTILLKRKYTIAVAESCTGGLLAQLLTEFSGSSKYLLLGVIAYSNKAKEKILRIPPILLSKHGAVSPEVASGMAKSVRNLAGADYGIGVTGIAGPTGGTPAKPVGTVFIAVAGKHIMICKKFHFAGKRYTVRKKTALASLGILKNLLRKSGA